MKNKTHFSLWVFDCDLHDALLILISLKTRDMVYFLFKFLLANFRGEKAAIFWWAPGGTWPRYTTVLSSDFFDSIVKNFVALWMSSVLVSTISCGRSFAKESATIWHTTSFLFKHWSDKAVVLLPKWHFRDMLLHNQMKVLLRTCARL